jgi:hypothetical protein
MGGTSKVMVYCQDLLLLLGEYVEECLNDMFISFGILLFIDVGSFSEGSILNCIN